eukprot:CAMPEP_0174961698 /NCGR_PEP_ID=MMETSP0004_2-20121128/4385_1 /TAXON_ID=420556 /ORGANISM="Ochromonas sp., Strain CCMP1393" /LENGTH=264 /DNA_ID=CAMNT_0016210173 /DNA_START=150 /DNA_END=944 /DNA_ORIENTATION=+
MLEWHFSFTGVEGTPYEGGVYHGRIKLHREYPQKAPAISMMTPSGRWVVNQDICLSASAHHPETWNPNWNLRTLVLSLRGFMTTKPAEIGSIRSTVAQQQLYAQLSRSFRCPCCDLTHAHLLQHRQPLLHPVTVQQVRDMQAVEVDAQSNSDSNAKGRSAANLSILSKEAQLILRLSTTASSDSDSSSVAMKRNRKVQKKMGRKQLDKEKKKKNLQHHGKSRSFARIMKLVLYMLSITLFVALQLWPHALSKNGNFDNNPLFSL